MNILTLDSLTFKKGMFNKETLKNTPTEVPERNLSGSAMTDRLLLSSSILLLEMLKYTLCTSIEITVPT